MSDSTLRFVPDLEPRAVGRIVRTALAVVGLLVVVGLAALLPGVDRLLKALAVSPTAALLAAVTLPVVAALLRVAPAVEGAVRQALEGPKGAVDDAAAGAKLLVGFLAVVVAYNGLAPAVAPAFAAFDLGGVYHLAFLVAGLVVLGAFVRRLYRCWGPVSRLLTDRVTDAADDRRERVAGEP